jgi:hypothetical protein
VHSKYLMVATAAALTLQGCSSRPREFTPTLAAATADTAAFDQAYAGCTELLVAGKLDQNGRAKSLGAGAAAGATTAAVGAGTAAAIGGYGGLAAASATIVLLPFAIVGGAWGMAKMKRAKKENAIKTALTGCLKEQGFAVNGWERAEKKRAEVAATASAASSTR